jgi:hypothetical protein
MHGHRGIQTVGVEIDSKDAEDAPVEAARSESARDGRADFETKTLALIKRRAAADDVVVLVDRHARTFAREQRRSRQSGDAAPDDRDIV